MVAFAPGVPIWLVLTSAPPPLRCHATSGSLATVDVIEVTIAMPWLVKVIRLGDVGDGGEHAVELGDGQRPAARREVGEAGRGILQLLVQQHIAAELDAGERQERQHGHDEGELDQRRAAAIADEAFHGIDGEADVAHDQYGSLRTAMLALWVIEPMIGLSIGVSTPQV